MLLMSEYQNNPLIIAMECEYRICYNDSAVKQYKLRYNYAAQIVDLTTRQAQDSETMHNRLSTSRTDSAV